MRLSRILRPLLCVLLSSLLPASAALAQSNYATLHGTVLDPGKQAIAGATVTVMSQTTGATRSVKSNEVGTFEVAGLLPGDYALDVEAQGFSRATRQFRLEVGQHMSMEVALQIGAVKEAVDVTAATELLKTAESSIGEVIEPKSIKELPLNGRMLVDLILTVPGAHISHGAQAGDMNPLYWRPGQRSAVSIGGNRPNANYFLLDGATNTDPTFNTLNLSPSPDAVQEFRVETGSYSAQMGGAGGGQVNIITRSGGEKFHGTAYDYLRNNVLDAHSFNEMGQSNHLVQNNFGASLGGPLFGRSRKTFFFVNYEGLRHTQAQTMIETVPTLDEINGDFSMSGVNIYDPSSSVPNPAFDPTKPVSPSNPSIIRTQFAGNVIPANRLSPVAVLFMTKYVPRPNTMNMSSMTMMGVPLVIGAGMDSNNYLDTRNERHVTDQGTMRVDHIFSNGDTLYGRYAISGENGFMPQNLPGFGARHDNLAQNGVLSYNHIINSSMLNVATFTVSRLSMDRTSENNGKNDIVTELGITGVGFGGQGAFGAPWFNVQGYSGMGDTFAATPMHAWDTILEGRDAFTWQKGKHALKFGGSYRKYIWPMWGFFQNRGYYQFTNGFTTRTATNDGTGSALASFMLGLPAVRQRQAGIPQMDLRQWYADGYAQDTWQLTHTTTIDVGLRYEYMSPLVDLKYTNTNLVFNNGVPSVFVGGQNGYPSGLMYSNKNNFAPRFGIAQSVPRFGMVLHAAFGIFYTPVDMNTWCNQRHNVPFVFPETNQSDNFVPSINTFNFAPPVLGKTVVSFAAFDPHAPAEYIEQWSTSLEKSLGHQTTLELGYLGSHGLHLQRAHLINNALPGPGAIQPRRPFKTLTFVPGTVLPTDVTVLSTTFPVSGMNLLENSAQSWYDAGYVNVRRRYSHGFSILGNYTWAKSLSNAPDFRSPMFESTIPQNNNNLDAEKGPACDVRHRLAISAVYALPKLSRAGEWIEKITENWQVSSVLQVQSGFPFTISVFGDTANSGTLLGENPIRANVTGQPIFGPGTHTANAWFNPTAFAAPAAFTFGNVGRNSVYGPGMQTLDMAIARTFSMTEKTQFQFRSEFFNALNHTNLGTPNRFVNTPQFGTITEAATPGRELQFSARMSF
jgi:hypothetical protein